MIKKYKELELVDSDYDLSLPCSEVDGFLPISVIDKLKSILKQRDVVFGIIHLKL